MDNKLAIGYIIAALYSPYLVKLFTIVPNLTNYVMTNGVVVSLTLLFQKYFQYQENTNAYVTLLSSIAIMSLGIRNGLPASTTMLLGISTVFCIYLSSVFVKFIIE